MNITQQYALDLYRSAQQGVPAPPAPGQHDWRVVAELREYQKFQAVVAGRPVGRGPAARFLRAARSTLTRWLRPAAIRGSAVAGTTGAGPGAGTGSPALTRPTVRRADAGAPRPTSRTTPAARTTPTTPTTRTASSARPVPTARATAPARTAGAARSPRAARTTRSTAAARPAETSGPCAPRSRATAAGQRSVAAEGVRPAGSGRTADGRTGATGRDGARGRAAGQCGTAAPRPAHKG